MRKTTEVDCKIGTYRGRIPYRLIAIMERRLEDNGTRDKARRKLSDWMMMADTVN